MLLQEEIVLKIKLIETEDRQRPISEVNASIKEKKSKKVHSESKTFCIIFNLFSSILHLIQNNLIHYPTFV